MTVVIAGGGIGGLTLALSLHQVGIEALVYESVPEIVPLGVGINLQPNAVRELTELGFADELRGGALELRNLEYCNKFGQRVWIEPRGLGAGYSWPQYSIHRGNFQLMLLAAVRERLGADALRTGHHLAGFEQRDGAIVARFVDRAGGADRATVTADVLVGADGIHSVVRGQLYPNERPTFDGSVMYRGALRTTAFRDAHTMVIAGHRKQRFITYPMTEPDAGGVSLVNWLCHMDMPPGNPPPETWNGRADKAAFRDAYGSWSFGWLDVPAFIDGTADVFQYPGVDRDPIPRWSFERVTLVGDAAHPVQPIGSQAGSQAIVDARVLAGALARESDPVTALRAYESARAEAMNEVTQRIRAFGPEYVLQLAEERAPQGFADVTDVLSRAELEEAAASFKRLAGLDPASLNSRASYVPSI